MDNKKNQGPKSRKARLLDMHSNPSNPLNPLPCLHMFPYVSWSSKLSRTSAFRNCLAHALFTWMTFPSWQTRHQGASTYKLLPCANCSNSFSPISILFSFLSPFFLQTCNFMTFHERLKVWPGKGPRPPVQKEQTPFEQAKCRFASVVGHLGLAW